MRVTPEILLKIANDFVAQRIRSERDLVGVYLHGSLLREHPTLGGTTDIDLFLIHVDAIREEREFVHITDDIHLDVSHHPASLYRRAKELRSHPWLGPALNECKILYDPQHFLDFTQASVRGQFNRPDYVLERVRPQIEHAREMWFSFQAQPSEAGPHDISLYLRALDHAANAIAALSGPQLTERRFLMDFPERAQAVRHAGLHAGLLGLLGTPLIDATVLRSWLVNWRAAYDAACQEQSVPRIHPFRLSYYQKAFDVLLGSEHFQAVLWPLWRTWTHAVDVMPADEAHISAWREAAGRLGMLGQAFRERIAGLDAFLDLVEETVEKWASENGA
jgi:hypothetical protein